MISTCAQTKTRSSTFVASPSPNRFESAFDTGDELGRPLVQAERDPRRVPEQQRRHDAGDQRQDQVGLAEVAALEARRALHLADQHRADHAGQHQHREHVDEEREPALVAEPRQRRVAVDRADHRDQDRREQDEEAPEDRRVDQARARAAGAACAGRARSRPRCATRARDVVGAVGRLAHPHEADEQPRAAREQGAADGERGREGERSGQRRLWRARLPQLGGDRRHDLGQVADHGVVGAGEDRRLGVGVDREDLLRALAAGDVLGGAADAAGDVEVGRRPSCRSGRPGRCAGASRRS